MRLLRQILARADEERVASGRHGEDRGLAHGELDRLHLEIVREEHALEAERAADEVGADRPRERRRPGIERGVDDVRRHHRGDGGLPRERAERRDLDPLEVLARALDAREIEVRVDRRVSVAGEMLEAGEHPAAREAARPRAGEGRDAVRRLGERAIADDGVVGPRVDVRDGREAHRDAERPELARLRLGQAGGEVDVPEVADPAHRRQREGGGADPHDASALLIDGDERRCVDGRRVADLARERGHAARAVGASEDVAAEEHDAPARAALERLPLARRELGPGEPDHEDLATESGQLSGHRLWSTTIVRSRSLVKVFLVGACGALGACGGRVTGPPPAEVASPGADGPAAGEPQGRGAGAAGAGAAGAEEHAGSGASSAGVVAAAGGAGASSGGGSAPGGTGGPAPATGPGGAGRAGTPARNAAPVVERPRAPLTVPEARRYMLALINRDRAAHGLAPVELDEGPPTIAGQRHAEDMVRLGYLGHWGSDGSVPEQRHTEAGGADMVLENALCVTDEARRTVDGKPLIDPKQVERAESLFFNEVPPNDGHRRNILKPAHTRVGIGVAQFVETAKELAVPCFAQEFVDGYGTYTPLPRKAKPGATVHVEGTLTNGARPTGVGVARLPLPRPIAASELNRRRSYPVPKPFQMYWGPGFVTPIVAKISGPKIEIDVPLSDKGQPGLYEVSVWAKLAGSEEQTMVSLRTILVE